MAKNLKEKKLLLGWLGLCLMYSIFLGLAFPGWIGFDDCVMAFEVFKGQAWGWQSMTYSFVAASGYLLLDAPGFTSILFVFYFLYLALIVIQIIDRSEVSLRLKLIAAFLLFVFSLWPTNQALILFQNRDTLFALISCHLGLLLILQQTWRKRDVVIFSLIVVVLGDLRQEAKIYLLLFPLLCGVFRLWNWNTIKIYLATIMIAAPIYYLYMTDIFNAESYTYTYKVTAYVHPLSAIFNKKGIDNLNPADVQTIHKVFDTEKLVKYYTPTDIYPFHKGGFNKNTTDEDWANFTNASQRLIAENFGLFVESRITMFINMLNMDRKMSIFYDEFRRPRGSIKVLLDKLNLSDRPFPLSSIGEKYYNLSFEFTKKRGVFWTLINSLLIPFLYLGLVCIFAYKFNAIYVFALLQISRLFIIFLLAPAAYYKYIYSIQLFFVFSLPLLLIFYVEKSRSKKIIST